ncbi:MAG TPA: hypothetical protein VMZ28_28510, partial [Kofleriaceae bacterium]|nr:hypothetical protein [Kofleriaceae bacterium]
DHVVPVAHGGASTTTGVRVLCKAHNLYEAGRVMGREAVEACKAARQMEADLVAGLKGMGVTAADARRAMAESRGHGASIEERLRAALAVLRGVYARQKGWHCEEAEVVWRVRRSAPSRAVAM